MHKEMKEDIGMEKKKYSIKEDFSMLALLIIPVGVAVNFVGGQLASILKLPMYLDTIGTIFAAMLCGPWVGAVTGGLTNVVTGIANPVTGGGTSIITAAAMAAGANIWAAFFGTEGVFQVLDRIISFLICWAVIKVIPPRTLVKFGCGSNYIKEKK